MKDAPEIRFVCAGKGPHLAQGGTLYINGHPVRGVMAIKPDLFTADEVATVTVTLAVRSFEFVPGE